MSQGIVDVLEAVQIQIQHSGETLLPARKKDRLANAVIQELPIGQPGEKVMLGGIGQLLLQCPRCAHVAEHDNRSGHLPLTAVNGGDGIFNRNFASVTADQNTVQRQVSLSILRCSLDGSEGSIEDRSEEHTS